MDAITCKACFTEIAQLPTGTWIDADGVVYCSIGPADAPLPVLHIPILPAYWVKEIKLLASYRPSFYTPYKLAQIMQLSEQQIMEVLGTS